MNVQFKIAYLTPLIPNDNPKTEQAFGFINCVDPATVAATL